MEQHMELQQLIYSILKIQIQFGVYRSGERLPTMDDACQLFQVSIRTIRTAYLKLQKDGYITISKKIGVKVKSDYSGEEIEQNIQDFFSCRKDALLDLSRSMRPLLSTAQYLGFQNVSPELLNSMEELTLQERVPPSHKMIQFLHQVYSSLQNDMLMSLVSQTLIFYQAPFMSLLNIPEILAAEDNPLLQMIGLCRGRKWTELRTAVENSQEQLAVSLCRFYDSRISMPAPKQQAAFCWSGCKKASQICYTLAMDLLTGVSRNIYPAETYLPSTKELAEEKQVSVITVRRALTVLNDIGAMRTINGVGTLVRSLDEISLHCDFSQPIVRKRLLDFTQSLQILAMSCKEVLKITLASLSPDAAGQLEDRLRLLRRIGQDELAVYGILELTTHFAPYAAIRMVYAELFRQLLWGYPLRGVDKGPKASKAYYQSCLDYFLDSLRRSDTDGFAEKLEAVLLLELDIAAELLNRRGIQVAADLCLTGAANRKG